MSEAESSDPALAGGGREVEAEDEPVTVREDRVLRLLAGGPDAVLSRLSQGDPFRLEALAATTLREEACLLDPSRVFERAIARVAHAATAFERGTLLEGWLRARVLEAIGDLLRQDEEEDLRAAPCSYSDERYSQFMFLLAVPPSLCRRTSVVFHAQPRRAREAFFALVIDKRSVEECLEMGFGPRETLREDVRGVLLSIYEIVHRAAQDQTAKRGRAK